MFVKLAVLSCAVAMASAVWNGPLAGGVPAHQFPAGVSPQACPNFPNCANPAVAAQPNSPAPNQWNAAPQPWNGGQQSWNGGQQGQWNAGAYNPAPVPQYNNGQAGLSPLDRGEYTGDGDYRGEGLAESGAYGPHSSWNNNNNNNQGYNPGAYNPQAPPAGLGQIPAGVNPQSCPNYPFCH
ncbi:translation initiation factor IF-2 [Aethina tumida]|uniref:translation initiation factor IF-2 n=1 Tax=Aethina tumida TaxID=116153 RepID=UPI00096B323C|nr:translation initiation factor IF-2 [Aethina tumida]